ncbi:hypothetical protein [Saccharospirillum salsuginis]|uniref:Sel1 repeat family protein n=1 Tax=Saccharospirillum salsuginis TaxID=418750 RepID=A0A918KKD0_9GAMM|nr:hypothetical protein [Saccharospirillum salsuginis]GGX64367.1 hypothetical protein GCM10007392_35150 [Saccharospirillum salsuginis]
MTGYPLLKWVFHQAWLTRHRWVHDRLMRGFRRYADRGEADAQELYGFLLLHKGVDEASRSSGARYLLSCAEPGRPRVAWQLYQCYRDGGVAGIAKNPERAHHFLAMAAEGGHPLAEEQLASGQ